MYTWFPDSRKFYSGDVSTLNFGETIKDSFWNISEDRKWKTFLLLMNLTLVISVFKVFPFNSLDRFIWIHCYGNYKSVTLPFQVSKDVSDVIPHSTILILQHLMSSCLGRSTLIQYLLAPQNLHWVSERATSLRLPTWYLVSATSRGRILFISWNLNFSFLYYHFFLFFLMSCYQTYPWSWSHLQDMPCCSSCKISTHDYAWNMHGTGDWAPIF